MRSLAESVMESVTEHPQAAQGGARCVAAGGRSEQGRHHAQRAHDGVGARDRADHAATAQGDHAGRSGDGGDDPAAASHDREHQAGDHLRRVAVARVAGIATIIRPSNAGNGRARRRASRRRVERRGRVSRSPQPAPRSRGTARSDSGSPAWHRRRMARRAGETRRSGRPHRSGSAG